MGPLNPLHWDSTEEGITDLESFFEYAGYKARDMREPLRDSRDYIQDLMHLQFETEGVYRAVDMFGAPGWEPLAPGYLDWKERHFPGEPILQLTHEMKDIVLADDSWHITQKYALYNPPSEKAGWHQEGVLDRAGGGRTHSSPNPLPPRPILVLDEIDYRHVEGIFEDWLDELRGANRRRGAPDPSLRPPIFG